jgi:hypothetical protein
VAYRSFIKQQSKWKGKRNAFFHDRPFCSIDEEEAKILKLLSTLDPINPRTIKTIIRYITSYSGDRINTRQYKGQV